MAIRPCRLEECPAVLDLWKAAETAPTATDRLEDVERVARENSDLFLVAEQDGRIVGTVIAGWDGWRGHIYRIAVLPACRQQGVGRSLVREAERRLIARGARRIVCLVLHEDAQAVAFWEALRDDGYERNARAVRYIKTLAG